MHYLSVEIPIAPLETATTDELIRRYSRVIRRVLRQHKLGTVDGWGNMPDFESVGRDASFTVDWRMRELGSALELVQEALVAAGAPKGTCIYDLGDPPSMRDEVDRWTPPDELFRIE
jgi:hypothetical protein